MKLAEAKGSIGRDTLTTDTIAVEADYVIARKRAFLATHLLRMAEAKKDDFAESARRT